MDLRDGGARGSVLETLYSLGTEGRVETHSPPLVRSLGVVERAGPIVRCPASCHTGSTGVPGAYAEGWASALEETRSTSCPAPPLPSTAGFP